MATTTALALDVEQYPEELEKREVYDLDFANDLRDILKQLAVNARDTTEREKWKKQSVLLALYSKKTENINEVRTRYMLGRKVRHEADNIGRLVAEGGIGLQTFCREVRNALGANYYHDIDIVNSQPTILAQLCDRKGWACPVLKRYIETREEVIGDVVDLLRREGSVREEDLRDVAKKRIVGLFNGGSAEGLTPFVRELGDEAYRIRGNVWNAYSEELKWLAKCDRRTGKAVAWVYQTEERKCLMAIARALEVRGRRMDVFIHDGGLVRKREGEAEFPNAMLREVEEDVFRETGYRIVLAIKPMTTSLERTGGTDNEYAERKRQFEETGWKGAIYFKVRHPAMFGCVLLDKGNEYSPMTKADLIQNEENNRLSDGEPFIKQWLSDPNIREYQRVEFAPKVNLPDDVFNLFRGFANVPREGGDLSSFYEIINIIANNDPNVAQWIVKWLAHIVQKPYKPTQVCIVVQGDGGVGKDTFFDVVVGGILGDTHYFSTSAPEDDIFAKFNSAIENRIVVKFEEANFHTNASNKDKLKGVITKVKLKIEHKGMKPYSVDNLINVVMTTNNRGPVVMEETGDRRLVLLKASNDRKNDRVYFGELRKRLTDNLSAFHHYLLNIDLTDFDVVEQRPLTDYYYDVKRSFIPYHAKWFQNLILRNDGATNEFRWMALDLFHHMKETCPASFNLNPAGFGIDMRDNYVVAGVLEKRKTMSANEYRIPDLQRLRAFIEEKGWWIDY